VTNAMPDSSPTEDSWSALISQALETTDQVLTNFRITRLHYLLSTALQNTIGAEAGANFHSWPFGDRAKRV
jgi:hypothetical protein